MVGLLAISAVVILNFCGQGESAEQASTTGPEGLAHSAVTGREQLAHQILTEAGAGENTIEVPWFQYDIGLWDQKGTEIHLSGDDASTLALALHRQAGSQDSGCGTRWYGELAFETDGLIRDPTTSTKILEFRGNALGQTTLVLELGELDPARRTSPPDKRLECRFEVTGYRERSVGY